MGKRGSEVQSLQRAIAILRVFTVDSPELGVTEISQRVGLHKSTTFRLLNTLAVEGLIAQDPDSGRYRLGLGLLELAGGVTVYNDTRRVARRHMRTLAEKIGATVSLAILEGDASINLEQAMPRGRSVVKTDWTGRRLPLHATSTGKALLAWLDPDAVAPALQQPLEIYTPHTIASVEALEAELNTSREAGYAIEHAEYETGLNAIAAPVRDHTGKVIAALSASGPSYHLTPERFEEVAKEVISAARAISAELGHVDDDIGQKAISPEGG